MTWCLDVQINPWIWDDVSCFQPTPVNVWLRLQTLYTAAHPREAMAVGICWFAFWFPHYYVDLRVIRLLPLLHTCLAVSGRCFASYGQLLFENVISITWHSAHDGKPRHTTLGHAHKRISHAQQRISHVETRI